MHKYTHLHIGACAHTLFSLLFFLAKIISILSIGSLANFTFQIDQKAIPLLPLSPISTLDKETCLSSHWRVSIKKTPKNSLEESYETTVSSQVPMDI